VRKEWGKMNNLRDLVDELKFKDLVKEEKKCNPIVVVLVIIGLIVVVAAAVYGVYRFFKPDYLEDFEDDEFEDEFEDDFFEDDEIIIIEEPTPEEGKGEIFAE
jgi:hypothetical protein